jgi:hypothetical protein
MPSHNLYIHEQNLHLSAYKLTYMYCARACGSGSQCRPNECIWIWETPGGRDFGWGVYEPGEGNGEVSLRATWERGGRILSQQGGFQVSREGLKRGVKGNQQGEKEARGMCRVYI